jgi:hypothetical protein
MRELETRQKLGRLSAPFASRIVRNLASAFDIVFRKALYGDTILSSLPDAVRGFRTHALDVARQRGIDPAAVDRVLLDLGPRFSSDRVRRELRTVGDARFADVLARDWQNQLGQIREAARAEVARVFFSGQETNLDALARRTVLFHYWISRATKLYTAEALKNPGLMAAYFRAWEGIEQAAEEGNYPGALKGFIRYMGGDAVRLCHLPQPGGALSYDGDVPAPRGLDTGRGNLAP